MVCKQRTGVEFGVGEGFEAKHTHVIKLYLGQMRPINQPRTSSLELVTKTSCETKSYYCFFGRKQPNHSFALMSAVQKLIKKDNSNLGRTQFLSRRQEDDEEEAVKMKAQSRCCWLNKICYIFATVVAPSIVGCGCPTWSWPSHLSFSFIIVILSLQFSSTQPKCAMFFFFF